MDVPCPKCGGPAGVMESLLGGFMKVACPVHGKQVRGPVVEGEEIAVDDRSWKAKAMSELVRLARSGKEFTADDVTSVTGFPDERNDVGALFRDASRDGLIHRVGSATGSNPQRHGGHQAVWKGGRS
jgi:hypothetical protein